MRAINFTSRYERAANRSNDRYVRFTLFVWESDILAARCCSIRTLIRHTHSPVPYPNPSPRSAVPSHLSCGGGGRTVQSGK
jgi:hypothetical protein